LVAVCAAAGQDDMKRIAMGAMIAVTAALTLSTVALADTSTNTTDAAKPAATPAVTTGSIDVEPSYDKRMRECMAIWDKGTHMNKDQWRRSCKTTLQSLTTD
jgi:hypothetical protein